MNINFAEMNYWAILVSGIVYWLFGMLWFSAIVGKRWAEEMKKHGITLSKPSAGKMAAKSLWTFLFNLVVAFGAALLINALEIHTFSSALSLGLILGICIAAAVMIISYIWEGRSFALSFYDIFYPVVGILVSCIIIGLWH